ncbi:M17 family peptidase N-terminal domain-containing protein, partial [Synechococcus sp. BA-120 BA3]|nr:M17 family peptidase N-terminal domain-containing protein [Synechococcus sp. BA-120 BA3]
MEFRCLAVDRDGQRPLTESWTGDTLVVGLFAGGAGGGRGLAETLVGEALEGWLQRRRFEGKSGQTLTLERPGGTPATLILAGLGDPAEFGLDALRQAGA